MTKAKLARLIELERTCSRIGDLVPGPLKSELEALRAEFAAWEPDEEPAVYHVEVDPEHPAWGKE